MTSATSWDIFCKVIDNYGDIGICWRLAADLAVRGCSVRLWTDDPSTLHWMAPGAIEGRWPHIRICHWRDACDAAHVRALPRHDILLEGFGCAIPDAFLTHHFAASSGPLQPGAIGHKWINLEYFTAEGFARRSHGLPSPVMYGPAQGQTRHFFFPGLFDDTGGLLREPGLQQRQQSFDPAAWLTDKGLPGVATHRISLFCYEPVALAQLVAQLRAGKEPTDLLVTYGRASQAVRQVVRSLEPTVSEPNHLQLDSVGIHFLPPLSQEDYDHLLWACDVNFVRGEDSLARAIWAGKPLVWQVYPQQDNAHHAKLDAMLQWLRAPASWRDFHHAWNGVSGILPAYDVALWREPVLAARAALHLQTDLSTRLLGFADPTGWSCGRGPESR